MAKFENNTPVWLTIPGIEPLRGLVLRTTPGGALTELEGGKSYFFDENLLEPRDPHNTYSVGDPVSFELWNTELAGTVKVVKLADFYDVEYEAQSGEYLQIVLHATKLKTRQVPAPRDEPTIVAEVHKVAQALAAENPEVIDNQDTAVMYDESLRRMAELLVELKVLPWEKITPLIRRKLTEGEKRIEQQQQAIQEWTARSIASDRELETMTKHHEDKARKNAEKRRSQAQTIADLTAELKKVTEDLGNEIELRWQAYQTLSTLTYALKLGNPHDASFKGRLDALISQRTDLIDREKKLSDGIAWVRKKQAEFRDEHRLKQKVERLERALQAERSHRITALNRAIASNRAHWASWKTKYEELEAKVRGLV